MSVKCKKCNNNVRYYVHNDELTCYKTNNDGSIDRDHVFFVQYANFAFQEYGQCENCGQIYDTIDEKININKPLDDFPRREW